MYIDYKKPMGPVLKWFCYVKRLGENNLLNECVEGGVSLEDVPKRNAEIGLRRHLRVVT